MFLAIVAAFYLPRDALSSRRIFNTRWNLFTERQGHIIVKRVALDDPSKADAGAGRITWSDVTGALSNWRLYGHCLTALMSSCVFTPINSKLKPLSCSKFY